MRTGLTGASALRAYLPFSFRGGDNPLAIADDAGVAAGGMNSAPITKGAPDYWFGNSNLALPATYLAGSQDG